MPDLICDTSVLQYLHQLGKLDVLEQLAERIILPPSVTDEIEVGHELGVDLPRVQEIDWIEVCHPAGERDVPLVTDMGPGETEVLMLTIEHTDAIAVLDDGLARRVAKMLDLPFTGTLGILLDARKRGLIVEVGPLLDRLEKLRFHLSQQTRKLVLRKAGEGG